MPVYIKRRAEWEDTFMCFLNTDVIATGSDENEESKWERLPRSPLMLLLYISFPVVGYIFSAGPLTVEYWVTHKPIHQEWTALPQF